MPHYKLGSVILHVLLYLLRGAKRWHLVEFHYINMPPTVSANVAMCLRKSVLQCTGMVASNQECFVTWHARCAQAYE